jgi:SAM-dependent methyltransferase
MKILEGIKQTGRPFNIPDASRDDLPAFLVEMGFKVGAEIGTSKGRYAELFGKAGLKLYCIDPWLDYPDYSRGDERWQHDLDKQYNQTKELLSPYNCILIRKKSMEALADIPDESLDFVYIDGNHEFLYALNDIHEWSKKVKKGGVISGHDYFRSNPHGFEIIKVKEAVDTYTNIYGIDNWYVIGSRNKKEGEKRDNFRSFMWIKK